MFQKSAAMVSLLVASKADPASVGPASALLSLCSSWSRGPEVDYNPTYKTGNVRMIQLQEHMVHEDFLEQRWESQTGEKVSEIIFMSKHGAASNRPALTVHPIGVPHLMKHENPPAGGRAGRVSPPNPRIGPWFRLLKSLSATNKLLPEFEVTLEATHHGPWTESPAMFVEIGSTEEYWMREDAAATIASVFLKGLGLDGGQAYGCWSEEEHRGQKVLLGLGGGHYAPRHGDIAQKEGVWVGHLLSGYSLLMTDPGSSSNLKDYDKVGGTWKEAILEAVAATKLAFPGGEVVVHLDGKSFKAWQRNAITWFLDKENIKVGKPGDFTS
ncbi:D-aminoacyl-tRNA deacylase isoform X2 [Physcomitrium patens]|uniref:D-aminoacyl-tRNA deacylase n=1 Tax=Physcomitrium patens TaxID=3218 RepID=A0A2K1KQQ2_PHYPA|nr:D-aminoacyl-tRNA deacylase-like isoform X2 [Physcomitrium patens]PNR56100.1 hypothetical protein PHYPA_006997 [Physcomitrium patens]|eukprot:XP_024372972.1 D-aminoacyl-tRNA deacylase-like isoform X2 [Physcomitrella patens]